MLIAHALFGVLFFSVVVDLYGLLEDFRRVCSEIASQVGNCRLYPLTHFLPDANDLASPSQQLQPPISRKRGWQQEADHGGFLCLLLLLVGLSRLAAQTQVRLCWCCVQCSAPKFSGITHFLFRVADGSSSTYLLSSTCPTTETYSHFSAVASRHPFSMTDPVRNESRSGMRNVADP